MSIKEIYNQGRVVGYSAYEIYVRQHMAEDPDTPPATEREWLASMIGSGASMLLKLDDSCFYKTVGDYTAYEIELPAESTLYAASTIVGSFFTGEANYDGHFATYIKDYGVLASNTASRHPDANETDHPMDTSLGLTDAQLVQLKQYAHIIDGVLIAPKTWERSGKSEPYMDFKPDLKDVQTIRILLRGPRNTSLNVPVLLTGFTMNSILSGVASEEGSTITEHPANGDFLGPGVIPWANKIVFSIPPAYVSYFHMNAYKRKLPTSAAEIKVQDTPVVDMMHTNPATYYTANGTDDRGKSYTIPVNVTELHSNEDGTAVLTVYSYDGVNLPPALYGTRVTSEGTTKLYPLDVVSPGTIKAFDIDNIEDARRLQNTVPGNKSIIINKDFTFSALDDDGNIVPVASTYITKENDHYIVNVKTGKDAHTKAVSLQDTTGADLPLSAENAAKFSQFRSRTADTDAPELGENPLVWDRLLDMLASDKGLDILGIALRKLRINLPDIDTTAIGQGVLNLSGTGESKVGGKFTAGGDVNSGGNINADGDINADGEIVAKGTGKSSVGGAFETGGAATIGGAVTASGAVTAGGQVSAGNNTTVKSGTQYVTFKDGKRLYISDTEPTGSDIPIGSIGIGWI